MPTGYTADVENGKITDLKIFALRCARAFGALVMLRDEPMDMAIPDEFKPSDYYALSLMLAKDKLKTLESMTQQQAKKECDEDYDNRVKYWEEARKKNIEVQKRYNQLLMKVHEWTPPSDEHIDLKYFMIEQLTTGSQFDTSYEPSYPIRDVPSVWLANKIVLAKAQLKSAQEEYDKENERTVNRNRWIKQLRESL